MPGWTASEAGRGTDGGRSTVFWMLCTPLLATPRADVFAARTPPFSYICCPQAHVLPILPPGACADLQERVLVVGDQSRAEFVGDLRETKGLTARVLRLQKVSCRCATRHQLLQEMDDTHVRQDRAMQRLLLWAASLYWHLPWLKACT